MKGVGWGDIDTEGETRGRRNAKRQRERRVTQGKINHRGRWGAGTENCKESQGTQRGGGKIQRRRSKGDI